MRVEGHVMEKKGRRNCILEELQNDEADELAKETLRVGLETDHADSKILVDDLWVTMNELKVTGCIKHAVHRRTLGKENCKGVLLRST